MARRGGRGDRRKNWVELWVSFREKRRLELLKGAKKGKGSRDGRRNPNGKRQNLGNDQKRTGHTRFKTVGNERVGGGETNRVSRRLEKFFVYGRGDKRWGKLAEEGRRTAGGIRQKRKRRAKGTF